MTESGGFYNTFVDPFLVKMRVKVASRIDPGKKIIDVACGTGAQVFLLAPKSECVVGVDISPSMIKKALQIKNKNNVVNSDFKISDASDLSDFDDEQFDFATMSLALHQFNPMLHSAILNEIKRISKEIIITDYAVPLPKNLFGHGIKWAEFIAGYEHNRNFKKYCKAGGLNSILPQNNLKITYSEFFARKVFQLVICIKQE